MAACLKCFLGYLVFLSFLEHTLLCVKGNYKVLFNKKPCQFPFLAILENFIVDDSKKTKKPRQPLKSPKVVYASSQAQVLLISFDAFDIDWSIRSKQCYEKSSNKMLFGFSFSNSMT